MPAQPRQRRLEVEDIGDITVVNFVDKKIIDSENIEIIGQQLMNLVDELGRTKLLLNFGNVQYLSAGEIDKTGALSSLSADSLGLTRAWDTWVGRVSA